MCFVEIQRGGVAGGVTPMFLSEFLFRCQGQWGGWTPALFQAHAWHDVLDTEAESSLCSLTLN